MRRSTRWIPLIAVGVAAAIAYLALTESSSVATDDLAAPAPVTLEAEALPQALPAAVHRDPPPPRAEAPEEPPINRVAFFPSANLVALRKRFEGKRLALDGRREAIPPDPVESGTCQLEVKLFDRASIRPIASAVQLWRLGAPASETYAAGDQLQYWSEVPAEGKLFEELSPGRYRLVCLAEGISAPDQPAFEVAGPLTRRELLLTLPGRYSIHLAVHRLDGTRVERAQVRMGHRNAYRRRDYVPAWRKKRERKVYGRNMGGSFCAGMSSGGHRPAFRTALAEARGFRLGPFEENDRERAWRVKIDLRLEGGASLPRWRYTLDAEPRRYLTLLVEPAVVLDSLRLPDGRNARGYAEKVQIQPGILGVPEGSRLTWRDVPVAVKVEIPGPGYKAVSFSFKPGDLPLPVRWLED